MTPKNEKRSLSLNKKLMIYFLVFAAAVIGLLWIFQICLLNGFYRTVTSAKMNSMITGLTQLDGGEFSEYAARIGNSDGVCSSVYEVKSDRLSRVCDFHTDRGCFVHALPDRSIVWLYRHSAQQQGESYWAILSSDRLSRRFSERTSAETEVMIGDDAVSEDLSDYEGSGGGDSVLCAEVFTSKGKTYFAMLSTMLIPISSTSETLTLQLAAVTLIAVALGAALALIFSKRLSGPLAKLNSNARLLPAGGFRKENIGGCREIQELENTLDKASGEIEKVEKLRRELIANVSHDLRTPLTLISGYAQMMRDIPGEANTENLQVIIDEADRLGALVKDMLDISKLEAGMETPDAKPFDLCAATASLLRTYDAMSQIKGFTIRYSHPDRPVTVCADEKMISSAIYNLVNNAVNHSGDSRTVEVALTVEDGEAVTRVIDGGEGIAPEDIDRIWDRYYRAGEAHKRDAVGTGLGLSITRRVFELNGCRYGVDSEPGKGSCFWFALRIA